jgi:peptidoglycan/xylan/chitin deacetylase (PgdA/CDA1 family)
MAEDPVVIVTTSWDDGHSTDLRVAELLAAHRLKATFYVAFNHPNKKEISDDEIRMLHRAGMEIGSHTLTHRLLTRRPAAEVYYELKESRMRLEDIVGAPVTAFSYPQGAFSAVARAALADTGYRLGRSTMAFRTAYEFDPLLMPISLEFCPYSHIAITRHAIRDGNLTGLTNWARIAKLETDPSSLGRLLFDKVSRRGGIFHLNARSWEIDRNELWDQLDDMVQYIAQHPTIHPATNSEVLSFTTDRLRPRIDLGSQARMER